MTTREHCASCGAGYIGAYSNCPYCGCDGLNSETIKLEPLIYDTECYRHYWLFAAVNPRTGQRFSFELFEGHPLDVIELRNVLTTHTMVGFNSIKYDMPIITYALSGATNDQLKNASDAIIQQQLQPWQFYREYNLTEPSSIDHVDIIEVAPGQASLKAYGGRMHTRKLQDLPYDPSEVIDAPKRAALREYCNNDLQLTVELWQTFQEQLALRVEMSEEYGIDLRSKSDAQIAENVLKSIAPFKTERPNVPVGTQFDYQPPEWLKFSTPLLQGVLARMVTDPFTVTLTGSIVAASTNHLIDWGADQVRLDAHGGWSKKPTGWSHELVRIGATSYAMGTGGLHSTESCVAWRADAEWCMSDHDVASYYPSLILGAGMVPPAIGKLFNDAYRHWYDTRLLAKKSGDKKRANSLKTLLNGSFGKLGSKWSVLYAPNLMLQVTMTGQLAILMLIEALELSGISVISANTDGIVVRMPRDIEILRDNIIQWWEATTGFETEKNYYKLLCSKDVNNYIAIYE